MLPFFFQHYDALVDQYFIYDSGSTDGSLDILRSHPKTVVREFRVQGTSFVRAAQQFNNECWKQSRGKAEWVIVCNIDEHLHHPDWDGYLNGLPAETSLIVPDGYNMFCEKFPESTDDVRLGQRFELLDKPQMFRPHLIEEMNFHLGRHGADPVGAVQVPSERQVKLLHFKFMGLDYFKRGA